MALKREFMYITSDKVGDFCQRMHDAGLDVKVEDNIIWVYYESQMPEQIYIFCKRSYDELCREIIDKKEEK